MRTQNCFKKNNCVFVCGPHTKDKGIYGISLSIYHLVLMYKMFFIQDIWVLKQFNLLCTENVRKEINTKKKILILTQCQQLVVFFRLNNLLCMQDIWIFAHNFQISL